jgi:lipopolysaccharide biosynthesis glycosyltransferase
VKTTLHLSCAADRGYVRHTAAMLHSVLTQSGSLGVQVHFLHGPELPGGAKRKLRQMVEGLGGAIDFLLVDDARVKGLPTFAEITTTMWHRIYLPELLPEVDRVLYLDGDTLALDSLEPLWATDLGSHLVAAVTNVLMPWARTRPAELGLAGPEAYFNSGVLLLNLSEMRADATTEKLLHMARSGPLLYPDQDALNAIMASRRLALHPRWNCMNSTLTVPSAEEVFDPAAIAEARLRPGIRHFEGPGLNKPWNRACSFPHRERYFEHRRSTPWPRVRMEGRRRAASA